MNLDNVTSTVNLLIALIGLGGFGAAAIWKLRSWVRADMEMVTQKHIGPIAESQKQMSLMVADHNSTLYGQRGHGERIAWLEGREEARKEITATANMAVAAQIIHDQQEHV